MVVTYLKESGRQLSKTDLFVSSLITPFQLRNLQAHVEPNCSMSANKVLGVTRRNASGVHRRGAGQPEINYLALGIETPLSENADKTTDRQPQLFLDSILFYCVTRATCFDFFINHIIGHKYQTCNRDSLCRHRKIIIYYL